MHRARGRPGDRHRHALQRLHDRLQDRVPEPERALHQHQRGRVRRATSTARCRWSAMRARRWTNWRRRWATTTRATAYRGRAARHSTQRGTRKSSASTTSNTAAAQPGRGDRRGQRALATRRDVVVCAAGSLPGDLHKLWRTRDPKGYHLEYGYSRMGYEIAGGLGDQDGRAGARGLRDGRRRPRT